jgi:hypothetical protein
MPPREGPGNEFLFYYYFDTNELEMNLCMARFTLEMKWEAVEKTSQGPWLNLEKRAFWLDNFWM